MTDKRGKYVDKLISTSQSILGQKRSIEEYDETSKRIRYSDGTEKRLKVSSSDILTAFTIIVRTDDDERLKKLIEEHKAAVFHLAKKHRQILMSRCGDKLAVKCFTVLCLQVFPYCIEEAPYAPDLGEYSNAQVEPVSGTFLLPENKTEHWHVSYRSLCAAIFAIGKQDDVIKLQKFIHEFFIPSKHYVQLFQTMIRVFWTLKSSECFRFCLTRFSEMQKRGISVFNRHVMNGLRKEIEHLTSRGKHPETDVDQLLLLRDFIPQLLFMSCDFEERNYIVNSTVGMRLIKTDNVELLERLIRPFDDFSVFDQARRCVPYRETIKVSLRMFELLLPRGLSVSRFECIDTPEENPRAVQLHTKLRMEKESRRKILDYFVPEGKYKCSGHNGKFLPPGHCAQCMMKKLLIRAKPNEPDIIKEWENLDQSKKFYLRTVHKAVVSSFILASPPLFYWINRRRYDYVARSLFCDIVHYNNFTENRYKKTFPLKSHCKLVNSVMLLRNHGLFVYYSWVATRPVSSVECGRRVLAGKNDSVMEFVNLCSSICCDDIEWVRIFETYERELIFTGFCSKFRKALKNRYSVPEELANTIIYFLWLEILSTCECVGKMFMNVFSK
ncbi:MAG: hypothetical protein JSS82_15845 [Bacteroidetes bacterium]|nr:hypothetical protein [Bacteroidota bacterium]